jgi:hypothetical protein
LAQANEFSKERKTMRKTNRTEPFRVVVDTYWPRTSGDSHNIFYHEYFDSAQARYMKLLIDQVMETRLIMHIAFERRNEHTNTYVPMFESFVHQTPESHGLSD